MSRRVTERDRETERVRRESGRKREREKDRKAERQKGRKRVGKRYLNYRKKKERQN